MPPKLIPLTEYQKYPEEQMINRSREFLHGFKTRRSVREYSSESVPEEVIMNCIRAAGTAPSGANLQPWRFVVIKDPHIKRKIRIAAEAEEKKFYTKRASQEWLDALAPLGTDAHKPFLEEAPYLICIFALSYQLNERGIKTKHYYVQESVGIATGVLITALHFAGLVCLTHTPSPMGFLNRILDRPENERPYLLLVVGFPKKECRVPEITKKNIDDIAMIR